MKFEELSEESQRIHTIRQRIGCGMVCARKIHNKYPTDELLEKFYAALTGKIFAGVDGFPCNYVLENIKIS